MIKEYFIRAGKNRVNQQKKLIFSDTDTNWRFKRSYEAAAFRRTAMRIVYLLGYSARHQAAHEY